MHVLLQLLWQVTQSIGIKLDSMVSGLSYVMCMCVCVCVCVCVCALSLHIHCHMPFTSQTMNPITQQLSLCKLYNLTKKWLIFPYRFAQLLCESSACVAKSCMRLSFPRDTSYQEKLFTLQALLGSNQNSKGT